MVFFPSDLTSIKNAVLEVRVYVETTLIKIFYMSALCSNDSIATIPIYYSRSDEDTATDHKARYTNACIESVH